MLSLTRKQDEKIMIGDDVVVTVVDIRNHKVRIGTEAPISTSVLREELQKDLNNERRVI